MSVSVTCRRIDVRLEGDPGPFKVSLSCEPDPIVWHDDDPVESAAMCS